jgi:DNA-binding winged helix-turn-helix (wHTH) protein/tetratricopeptide (TPR) repeat protein
MMDARRQILFEPFRLDPANACLWRGPQAIHLTPKVYALLSYLLDHAGRLVTKDELLRAVWPDTIVGEASLPVCVREIRKALGDHPEAPRFIETVHRRGYRFIAPTSEIDRPVPDVRPPVGAGGGRGWGPAPGTTPPGLVGREGELLRLEQWLGKALQGDRQVVLISGEAGIGKTAVVEAFRRRLGEGTGLWLARGECFEHHGPGEAYMPVLEALHRLGREVGRARLAALLGRRAPTWLAQLPALNGAAGVEPAPHETLGATPERMLREFAEAVEELTAETPLVLVLEDLHWSDYSTLDFVSALARRRDPARLLLLGTYRPADVIIAGHPLHAVRQELLTHGCCEELPLELLTEAAVAEYLALRFPGGPGNAALARLVHAHTDGNPLFMVHLVDDLASQGALARGEEGWASQGGVPLVEIRVPDGVRPTIEKQLARLAPEEQRLLEGASVAGMEFSAAVVAAALGEDVVAVEERCEGLVRRRHFLRAAGVSEWPDGTLAGRFGFLHWLYQDLLYRRVAAARRRVLHQRLGERLEAAHGDGAGEIAVELARHFEQGGDVRRAIRHLRQAAENAGRRHAHREAMDSLQRALDLVGRLPEGERADPAAAVLEQRGRLRRGIGDMPGAAADFAAIVEFAGVQAAVRVKALLHLASALYWIDRARCLAAADRAIELSRRVQDPSLQAHARGQCGHWRLQICGWQGEEYRAFAAGARAARRSSDRALRGVTTTQEAHNLLCRSEYRASRAAAEEGKQLTLESGDVFDYMSCLYVQAYALLHLGEFGEGLRAARDGLAIAEKNRYPMATRVFCCTLGWFHEESFDFTRARELYEPAALQARDGEFDLYFGLIRLGMAQLGLRDLDAAARCFHEVTDRLEAGATMDWILHMHLHRGLGEYWLGRGEYARARQHAERTCALAGLSGERAYRALGLRALAEVALAGRDWDRAEAELSRALELLEGGESPLAEWRVHATAALLHRRRRSRAAADRCRARSLAVLDRLADSLSHDTELHNHMMNNMPI